MKLNNIALLIILFLCLSKINAQANFLWNIQTGIDLYNNKQFKNAEKFFQEYKKYNPNDETVYYWLARICKQDNKEKEKKEHLQKFYELISNERNIEKINFKTENTDNLEDYFDMAIMYFEDGNFFEANYYADLILNKNPKSASAYFIKAKLAQLSNKTEEAKQYLNQAIIYNHSILETNLAKSLNIYDTPELSKEMYLNIAQEAFFNLDFDNSIENAKKYIKLDFSNPNIYTLLFDSYLYNNDINNAKSILLSANKIFPNNLQIELLNYKKTYIEHNFQDAKKHLEKAHKINPNNSKVLYELGKFYIQEKKYQQAKKYFETLVISQYKPYESNLNYLYCLIKLGQYEKALKNTRKLSILNKNTSELNYLLGLICKYQGDFNSAKDYTQKAIKETQNPYYYLELGKLNYIEKDYYKANKNLNYALENITNEKGQHEIINYLVKIYINTKDYDLAKNILNNNSLLDKNSITYKYNLYILYKLTGNDTERKKLFKELKKIRPSQIQDYIDLYEFYYYEINPDKANILFNKGIKKYPNDINFYLEKVKISYMTDNQKLLKSTIIEMNNKFNCP